MSSRTIISLAIAIITIHAVVLILAFRPEEVMELADNTLQSRVLDDVKDKISGDREAASGQTPAQEVPAKKDADPSADPSFIVPQKPAAKPVQPSVTPQKPAVKPQKPATEPEVDIPAVTKKPKPEPKRYPSGSLPPIPEFRPLNWKNAATGNLKGVPPLRGITQQKATGILVDLDSRKVLWHKESNRSVQIASMTKLMTLLLAYEMIHEDGSKLTMDSEIPITKEARKVPPSGVAFQLNEVSFPLRKLMQAAAVKSANDATYLIAQTVCGGSAEKFVAEMNSRARALGMNSAQFFNPHGLNEKSGKRDNRCSVLDMVRLCEAFLTYPEIADMTSIRFGEFRKPMDMMNHNLLLPGARTQCKGVCGLKTGFTQRAGYCVAALCVRDGRRLLAVVTGFSTQKERDEFTRGLLNWGFKH